MTPKLIATYRLQLSSEFTLHDARKRLPYLNELGISHVYCSPVLAARSGSTHGYDVADPTQVSEVLGGEGALVALADDAHARGMGILLDIVPNHMGVGADNLYWDDVLAHGKSSRYADWFDVTWRAPTKRLTDKVLLPILGDTLAHIVERDEITLQTEERGLRVRYFEHSFPLNPQTIPAALQSDEAIAEWVIGAEGRARLRRLLGTQHYELAFWRAAHRDINYRRFFDVNELISLRVDQEDVFAATHGKVLKLAADGVIDGVRVDHIDGLLDPRKYLVRLREAVGPDFLIYVEKILSPGELLADDWPVDGTTGYEFLIALEDIFIDPDGAESIERSYRGRREQRGFNRVAMEAKRRALRTTLNADVRHVAPMLARVAACQGWPVRTVASYAGAIVEFVAAMPVYRTYIDGERIAPSERDRRWIEMALADARARGRADHEAIAALERVLLDDWSRVSSEPAQDRLECVLRLQQLSGPAAAKGVEDTALYVYAPLTSRNEVGGDPAVPVRGAVKRLTERLHERAERFPRSLNATNTHDTKRSADARARIDALSEHSADWQRSLRKWRRTQRVLRRLIGGRLVPGAPNDDFAYQALLAVWPLTVAVPSDDGWLTELRDRLKAYLLKANREAKVSTSWTNPDVRFEEALTRFIDGLLDPVQGAAFHQDVVRFVGQLAPQALWNTLGRLVLHLMSPGVPDIYQGDEIWYAALVDPDNRRAVDWEARMLALAEARTFAAAPDRERRLAELRDEMRASELKMFILSELLALRSQIDELNGASFHPLQVEGSHCEHLFAVERECANGTRVAVLVARQTNALPWPQAGEVWRDMWVRWSSNNKEVVQRVIHGGQVRVADGAIRVADALSSVPVEVLVTVPQ